MSSAKSLSVVRAWESNAGLQKMHHHLLRRRCLRLPERFLQRTFGKTYSACFSFREEIQQKRLCLKPEAAKTYKGLFITPACHSRCSNWKATKLAGYSQPPGMLCDWILIASIVLPVKRYYIISFLYIS